MANKKDLNRTQKLTELNTALDWVGISNAFWMEGDNSAYWNVSSQGGASSREFQNEISYLKRLKVDLEKDLALERSRATMTESEKLKSLREEIDKKKKRIADLEISVKQAVRVWEGSKEALRDIHFALGTKNLQEVIVEMGGNSLKELSRRAKEGKAAGEDWSDISIQFNKPEIKKAWTDLGITYKDAYVWVRGGFLNYNSQNFVNWATHVKAPPIDCFEYLRATDDQRKKWWKESKLIEESKPLNKTGQIVINNVSNHNFVETVAEQYLSLHLGSQVEYVGFDERLVVLKDSKFKRPQELKLWYHSLPDLVSGGVRFNALKAKISSGKAIKKLTINVLKITDDTYNLNIKYSPVSSTNPVSSINIAADNFAPINDTDLELVNATPPAGWKLWQHTNPVFDSEAKVKSWEDKGFNLTDSNRWIKIGRLTVDESAFARWLVSKGGDHKKPEWVSSNKGTAKAQYQLEAEEIGTINFINGFKDVKYDNSAKTITLVYNGSVLDSLVLTGVKAKEKVPADKLGGTKQLVINLTGDDARFERLRNKLILAPLEIGCKIELIKGSTLSVSGENLVITKDSFEDLGVKVTQKPVASYLNKLYNDLQPYLTTGSGVGGNEAEWGLVKKLLAEYTAEEVEPNVKVLVTRLDAEKASYASSGKFDEIRKRLNDLIGVGSTGRKWEALTERIIPDLAKDPSTSEVPPLAMSAQGVTDTYYDTNLPPRGSCIMTKSGDLVFDGIAEIVNPLSGSNSDATKAPSVPFLIKSIQNTILLLERNNKPSVAFPLIGGELFLNCFTDLTGTKDAKQQELAEAIIISAIKQRSKDDLVLKFLDYKGNAFQRVWGKIKDDAKYAGKTNNVWVLPEDRGGVGAKSGITRFAYHNCQVIANAPNLECKMSGGGVTGAIAKLIGDLNVNKISEEASNNITEYWKRYKKLGGEVPPLTLEEKKTNLVKEVQDIIDHYTAGIADAERHFETKGQDDGHWGGDRGDSWKKYIGNITKDDSSSDADTNFKDIRYAILTVLAETLVSAYLIERDEKNLQKLVDAQRDPIFINIYTRSDFEDTIKDLGVKVFSEVTDWGSVLTQIDAYLSPKTVTSFENIKKWVQEKHWPNPIRDIDLGGADLTTLRGLKVGSSRDIIDKATGVSEHWKNYTPLATSTDGNCFLNALAILLTGDDKVETQKRVALQLRVALLLNLIQEHRYYFTNINDFYRVVLENSDDDTTTDSGSKMVTKLTENYKWLSTDDLKYFIKILKRPLISVFDDSKTKTKFKDSGGIGSFAMGIADQEDIYYYYKPFVIFNQGATHFEPLIINEKHTDGYIEFNCKKVTFEDEKNEADGRSILIETLGSAGKFGFSEENNKKMDDNEWDDLRIIRIWYNGAEDAEKKAKEYKNVKEMFVDGHGAFNKEGETFVISAIRADEINFDDDEIHLYHNTYSGINLVKK